MLLCFMFCLCGYAKAFKSLIAAEAENFIIFFTLKFLCVTVNICMGSFFEMLFKFLLFFFFENCIQVFIQVSTKVQYFYLFKKKMFHETYYYVF